MAGRNLGTVDSLANHLLVAMPGLTESNFAQTVVLICEHTDRAALGIVLNKPLGMKLGDVMAQMKLEPTSEHSGEMPVLRGWEGGQLEREMLDNAWLSPPLDERIVFELPFEDRWHAAWQLLGVDSSRVSFTAGHA